MDSIDQLIANYTERRISRRNFVESAIRLGIAASAIGPLLAACQSSTSTSAKKTAAVVATSSSPPGLDPEFYAGRTVVDPMQNILMGLTQWKKIAAAESGGWDVSFNAADFTQTTVPGLADSWDVSPDGTVYTFHLAKGWMSHAGNELTSADVKWHFDRAFGLASIGAFLNNVMQIPTADSVVAVDKYTVKVTLSGPTPDFLLTMNDTFRTGIIDSTDAKKHATSSDPWAKDYIKNNLVGFGPYKLQSFEPGVQLVLTKHPGFPRPTYLEKITFKVVPSSSTRVSLVSRGDVDAAAELAPNELASLKSTAGVRVWSFPGEEMLAAECVFDFPPLNNKLVRQALSYAVPYSAILDLYHGLATASFGPLLSQAPGFDKSAFMYTTDITKAKQLLTQAGYPNGFETAFAYDNTDPIGELVGVQLQSSFQQIGVKLNLQGSPAAEASAILTGGKAPLTYFNLGADQPDPNYVMHLFFLSSSQINWSHYKNAQVDTLINQAAATTDWNRRVAIDKQINQLVIEDAALLWMAQPGYHIATRSNLTGMNWYGGDGIRWDLVQFT